MKGVRWWPFWRTVEVLNAWWGAVAAGSDRMRKGNRSGRTGVRMFRGLRIATGMPDSAGTGVLRAGLVVRGGGIGPAR